MCFACVVCADPISFDFFLAALHIFLQRQSWFERIWIIYAFRLNVMQTSFQYDVALHNLYQRFSFWTSWATLSTSEQTKSHLTNRPPPHSCVFTFAPVTGYKVTVTQQSNTRTGDRLLHLRITHPYSAVQPEQMRLFGQSCRQACLHLLVMSLTPT